MPTPKPSADETLELQLRTVLSHELFPGRSALTVMEIKETWRCTVQHVLDLIEENELTAFDIRGKVADAAKPSDLGNATARRCLRVPVSAYDDFVKRRSNLS